MVLVRDPAKQGILRPTLGLFTAITLIVGSMIGSGIFRLPADMMELVLNPSSLVWVWIVGGLLTICGALTFAELAGMFPAAGGQYAWLRESMGRRWAFLYGWTFFWVVQTGIIAAVALVFAEFTRRLFGFPLYWDPIVAFACILFLSIVNYFGAKSGGLVQNVFTIAKTGALLALVALGFLLGNPSHATFDQSVANAPTGIGLFTAFIGALLLGLFALDGWPQSAYVAPEIKNPRRNVPRSMILGVTSVVLIYLLATWVYVFLVDAERIAQIGRTGVGGPIAAAAAEAFAGETGARLISAAVMVSTFGTVNAFILTSPRIYYAVANDGLFWRPFRRLHPKYNTPDRALVYQGVWAGILIVLSRFNSDAYQAIVAAVVFCIWFYYLVTAIGYFKLRRTQPDAPRPYRTTLYPVVPIIFLASAVVVVGVTLGQDLVRVFTQDLTPQVVSGMAGIWGSVAILTGLPFLLYWARQSGRGEATPVDAEEPASQKKRRARGAAD